MMYQEFLRLSGATSKECTIEMYRQVIEPAYMSNDTLFPTKERVIDHWHRFGLIGFNKDLILTLNETVKNIQKIWRYANSPDKGIEEFANFLAIPAVNGRK